MDFVRDSVKNKEQIFFNHTLNTGCINLISWSNEEDTTNSEIILKAYDIGDNKLDCQGELIAKKCF